jgi:YbbR domain-containing protein
MNLIRGLIFDNLGLKLVALLLAVLVYLNVYTDRPATIMVSFPLQLTGMPDSVTLSGPVPAAVQAEVRGTGKQLIRLRLTEPRLGVSLAGVQPGRFERAFSAADLPLPEGVEVERLVGPRMLELELDRKRSRRVPVAPRIEGVPGSGASRVGRVEVSPMTVLLTGPSKVIAELDTLALSTVRIDGRRDTVRVQAGPDALPDWCTVDPPSVTVTVPLQRRAP